MSEKKVSEVFKERINELFNEQQKQGIKSASAMAAKAGLSSAAMNFYLSGERRPDLEALHKICSAFDCPADWLLGLTDVRSPSNDVQLAVKTLGISERFIEKQKQLDDKSRQALYRLLETEGFVEAVLEDYIDYETVREELKKLVAIDQKSEEQNREYNPHMGNGCIVLPPNDAATYYAEKVGRSLAEILDSEITEQIVQLVYDLEEK